VLFSGYSAAYAGRYSLGWLGAMLNVFLLAMSLVVLADNVLTFLLVWEGMSLASYFLVMTEHERPDTVAAGVWYLAMTHVGLVLQITSLDAVGAWSVGDTVPPGLAGLTADFRSWAVGANGKLMKSPVQELRFE